MSTPAVLAIDLGTGSIKALLIDRQCSVLGSASASYPVDRPRDGWAEQSPDDWWNATADAVRGAVAAAGDVSLDAIGLSGQMHGTVLIDSAGRPVRPAIIWEDRRSAKQVEALTEKIGAAQLIDICGSPIATGFQAATLAWLVEHEATSIARTSIDSSPCRLSPFPPHRRIGNRAKRCLQHVAVRYPPAGVVARLARGGWHRRRAAATGLLVHVVRWRAEAGRSRGAGTSSRDPGRWWRCGRSARGAGSRRYVERHPLADDQHRLTGNPSREPARRRSSRTHSYMVQSGGTRHWAPGLVPDGRNACIWPRASLVAGRVTSTARFRSGFDRRLRAPWIGRSALSPLSQWRAHAAHGPRGVWGVSGPESPARLSRAHPCGHGRVGIRCIRRL